VNNITRYKHKLYDTILADTETAEMAKMECKIPDFSEVADSDAEYIAMNMEYAARRTREISTQMVTAKDENISRLWHERHCFIGKLAKNIKNMQSIETEIS
jgi:hypothetical protein